MQEQLGRYPVAIELDVAWGDMDALAHVNNCVYIKWFETVRIAYFEALGLMPELTARKVGPILAHQECDYRAPVSYPDRVRVSTTVTKFGTSSFTMAFRVDSQKLGRAAEGSGVMVMVSYATGVKLPLDEAMRARILGLEATGS